MQQRDVENAGAVTRSIIKDGVVTADDWQVVGLEPEIVDAASSRKILPLEDYLTQGHVLFGEDCRYAVWLSSDEDFERYIELLLGLPLIAVYFSSFTDGRGFSMATLLRERYGYQGELRAIGQILPDQLHYLKRCGFSAFQFEDGVSLEDAMQSLDDFSSSYQPAAD